MLVEEAVWIKSKLQVYADKELFPMLNLGSGTRFFRTVEQAHIEQHIFKPLRTLNHDIIHSDRMVDDGVDLVGDLEDDNFLAQLGALEFQSVICTNLLEHVPNREAICATINQCLVHGGLLILSVPYRFPYHPEPIDTCFRPSPVELIRLFPSCHATEVDIVWGKRLVQYNPKRAVIDFVKLCLPFWKPHNRPRVISTCQWYFRRVAATCVILRKS